MGDERNLERPRAALAKPNTPVLFQRVELSGAVIEGENFVNVNAERAKIADTMFRRCRFIRCCFRTADFEAAVFEDCVFDHCDFRTADFRSSQFARCVIDNCIFSSGAIQNCNFYGSKIVSGKFDRQSLEESRWTDCTFIRFRLRRATSLHLEFNNCELEECEFADCTSLYHFFRDCRFVRSRMDVDTLALSFGLTRDNLRSLTFVWQGLGQRLPKDQDALLKRLLRGFVDRHWGIAACALSVNFALLPAREAFRLAFASVRTALNDGLRIRSGEVKFLARLVEELSQGSDLPFVVIAEGLDLCADLTSTRSSDVDDSVKLLAFTFKEAELQILGRWQEVWNRLHDSSRLMLEFTFEQKPNTSLMEVLCEIHTARHAMDAPPRLVETRRGSHIEVVMMGAGSLTAFVIALGMVARSIDKLIIIRAKTQVLFARRLPPAIRTRALEPLPSISAELGREISMCLSLLSAGQLPLTSGGGTELASHLRSIIAAPAPGSAPLGQGGPGGTPRAIEDHSGAS